MNTDFLFIEDDWFTKKYESKSGSRFSTFKIALNLLNQRGGSNIVETGCVRMDNDFGAGMSSFIFCDYLSHYGGHLWTVDISPQNIATCERITAAYKDIRTCVINDSVNFLTLFGSVPGSSGKIDLLYLDSYDYPYFEMLDRYGYKTNQKAAIDTLNSISEEEALLKHGDLIGPCQQHCLNELMAALPFCHDDTIILIDDNNFKGGGKSRLAKKWLLESGKYQLLLDNHQTLWIRR